LVTYYRYYCQKKTLSVHLKFNISILLQEFCGFLLFCKDEEKEKQQQTLTKTEYKNSINKT
jgi:hypothetical protein